MCGVRVHAEEAVVRRGDRGGDHLALDPADRGPREVVDQELIGEAAQMDSQAGGQSNRGANSGDVGQTAHDRFFLRPRQALFLA